MNRNLPFSFGSILSLFLNPLALLGGVLLCLSPIAARGQSVTFAGAQSIPPPNGLGLPTGAAVDGAGNVFISDASNGFVLELPRTAIGYGPNARLPVVGHPQGIATDLAGDVFISLWSYNDVVELPKTATGFGPQTTLPFTGLSNPWGVAVDSAGDVFVTDVANDNVVELPWTGTGYGPQITVLANSSYVQGLAADSAGNLFSINDGPDVVELPKSGTGYGLPITVPGNGASIQAVAVDSAGDLFLLNAAYNPPYVVVLELPWTGTGYGPPITLPFSGVGGPDLLSTGLAVDSAGDVFVADDENAQAVELQTVAVDFWGANVCAPGATTPAPCSHTLTLNYNVNADTTLGKPEVLTGGMTHLDFTRASGSTCTGAVTAGSTCTVNVAFAPLAAGFRHGSVNITDSSGNFIATTQVSGFGVAPTTGAPVAQLSTSHLRFGTTSYGSAETLAAMVANIGGGTLTVAPSISGHGGNYKIADSTCAAGVTPGNSCTLVVEFSPITDPRKIENTLTVQTNGGSPTVSLSGSATGLGIDNGAGVAEIQFGTVPSGSTEVELLRVWNYGLGTVGVGTTITGHSYSVLTTSENTCQAGLAEGQSCILPVQFAPTKSGLHDDLLTLTPFPGGGGTTVWLTGSTP